MDSFKNAIDRLKFEYANLKFEAFDEKDSSKKAEILRRAKDVKDEIMLMFFQSRGGEYKNLIKMLSKYLKSEPKYLEAFYQTSRSKNLLGDITRKVTIKIYNEDRDKFVKIRHVFSGAGSNRQDGYVSLYPEQQHIHIAGIHEKYQFDRLDQRIGPRILNEYSTKENLTDYLSAREFASKNHLTDSVLRNKVGKWGRKPKYEGLVVRVCGKVYVHKKALSLEKKADEVKEYDDFLVKLELALKKNNNDMRTLCKKISEISELRYYTVYSLMYRYKRLGHIGTVRENSEKIYNAITQVLNMRYPRLDKFLKEALKSCNNSKCELASQVAIKSKHIGYQSAKKAIDKMLESKRPTHYMEDEYIKIFKQIIKERK